MAILIRLLALCSMLVASTASSSPHGVGGEWPSWAAKPRLGEAECPGPWFPDSSGVASDELASTDDLVQMGGREVGRTLASCGQRLHNSGDPLGAYLEKISAVVDLDRSLCRQLQAARDLADSWRVLVPACSHVPRPPALRLAMLPLALLWGLDTHRSA